MPSQVNGPAAPESARLLVTVSDAVWGGKHRYMIDTVVGLRRLGYAIRVAAEVGSPMADACRTRAVPVAAVPSYRSSADAARARLTDVVSELDPVAVCSTGRWDTAALGGALHAVPGERVRMIIRHSAFPLEDTDGTRDLLGRTDLVITTSREQSRRQFDPWISAGVLSENRVRTITSGVSTEFLTAVADSDRARTRRGLGIGDEPFVFLVGCRLSWEKGVERVLDALPEGDAEAGPLLLVAGAGEEEAALRRRAEASGIADRVRFLGHRDDMADLIVATDAVVLASTVPETGPLILKEAMAAARPVIASAAGGIPDFVLHARNGLLAHDDAEMAAAMRRLAQDRAAAVEMGTAGRATITREHLVDRRVEHLAELIDLASIRRLPLHMVLRVFTWADTRIRTEEHGGFVFVPRTSHISQLDEPTFARVAAARRTESLQSLAGGSGLPTRDLVDRLYRMGAVARHREPAAEAVR